MTESMQGILNEEQMLKKVMQESQDSMFGQQPNVSIAVQVALQNGFSTEQGMEAESLILCTMGE